MATFQAEKLRASRAGYRIEATAAEVGYRDQFVLLSRDSLLSKRAIQEDSSASHTRQWFEGKEPEAKDKDEAGSTIEIEGSVRMPKPPAKEGEHPGDEKAKPKEDE